MMRDKFSGFYGYTNAVVDAAYKDATTVFVFDTNILLSLYRCEESTREQFINVWRKLQEQVWLPFHVCLEYQRNRLTTINDARDSLKSINTSIEKGICDVFPKLNNGTISRYTKLKSEIDELKSSLCDLVDKFSKSKLETRRSNINFIDEHDSLRDIIDELSLERVGSEPTQDEVDKINKEGIVRYKYNTGPGYADAKDKSDKRFSYNSINYDSQYSDLYVWKQILLYMKEKEVRKVVYVTNDEKSDFYYQIQGKTRGPVESLVTEIKREAGVDVFILHNIKSFLHHAVKSLDAKIDEQSINELASAGKNSNSINRDYKYINSISGNESYGLGELEYAKGTVLSKKMDELERDRDVIMSIIMNTSNVLLDTFDEEERRNLNLFMSNLEASLKSINNEMHALAKKL